MSFTKYISQTPQDFGQALQVSGFIVSNKSLDDPYVENLSPNVLSIVLNNGIDDSQPDLSITPVLSDFLSPSGYRLTGTLTPSDEEGVYEILERRWYSVDDSGGRTLIEGEASNIFYASTLADGAYQYEIDYLDGELNRRTSVSEVETLIAPADNLSDIQSVRLTFLTDQNYEDANVVINGTSFLASVYYDPSRKAGYFESAINREGDDFPVFARSSGSSVILTSKLPGTDPLVVEN